MLIQFYSGLFGFSNDSNKQLSRMINGNAQKFSGLFSLPGEGIVAQLRDSTGTIFYDKQGLQFLILQRKESGLETRAAEEALAKINTLSDTLPIN